MALFIQKSPVFYPTGHIVDFYQESKYWRTKLKLEEERGGHVPLIPPFSPALI